LAKYYLRRIAGEDVPNIYKTVIRHKNGSDVPIEIKASVVQYQGRLADFAIVRKATESDKIS
jgi:PAS domain S-box-containing protein